MPVSKVAIQGDMWEAAQTLPRDEQDRFVGALVRYGMTGEEPDPAEPWYIAYVCCRDRIGMSAKRSRCGEESATRRWGPADPGDGHGPDGGAPTEGAGGGADGCDGAPTIGTQDGCADGPAAGGADAEMRGDEMRGDEERATSGTPGDGAEAVADSAVSLLNELAGTSFRPRAAKTMRPVRARLREGFTADDFRLVVEDRCREWLSNRRMREYLRPETLFGTKFEGYLQAARSKERSVCHGYDQGVIPYTG